MKVQNPELRIVGRVADVDVETCQKSEVGVNLQGVQPGFRIPRRRLKQWSLWLKGVGVLLLLLSLLGVFRHHGRIQLYEQLREKREVTATSMTARRLMKEFGFPPQQIVMIDTLVLHDLRFGKNGPPLAGQVEARTRDGLKRTITDLMKFKDWAYSTSSLYGWFSFSLVILGFIIDIGLYLKERRQVTLPI